MVSPSLQRGYLPSSSQSTQQTRLHRSFLKPRGCRSSSFVLGLLVPSHQAQRGASRAENGTTSSISTKHVLKTQFSIHITSNMSTISTNLYMNPYSSQQQAIFAEAVRLLEAGLDCGILAGKLDPEYAMRLRIHSQMLPESTRNKSLYGRAHAPAPKAKKR